MKPNTNHRGLGKLIALEGKEGREITALSQTLKHVMELAGYECIISRWNLSSLFTELLAAQADVEEPIPFRALAMVQASDLAHRMKNEIGPALQSGRSVIVDQYLYTSLAIAMALGANPLWIDNLYAFAPKPDLAFYSGFQLSATEIRHLGAQPALKVSRALGRVSRLQLSTTAICYLSPGKERPARAAIPLPVEKEELGFYQVCLRLMAADRLRFDPQSFERRVNRSFDRALRENRLRAIRSEADIQQMVLF
jgi:hypothetical protein